ncbi:glycosyltransferase [Arenicella xantha]|nr:glycosyltransferase [Arenicella xantha]
MTLLVVIVNYFSANLIEKLVQQINTQDLDEGFNARVVCVDNSVNKDQRLALKKIKDTSSIRVNLIFSSCNVGFGNAINAGLHNQSFDFACFINPDVTLQPDTLSLLLDHASSNPHQGIWGGLTVDRHFQADYRHAWREPSLTNTFAWATGLKKFIRSPNWQNSYQHHVSNQAQPYYVDCVSGCCLMISNSAWQATQGFDPDFFLYSEEIDLCRRARALGYQPTVIPRAKLTHSTHSNEESAHRVVIIFLAKIQYIDKHHGQLYTLLFRFFIAIGSFIRAGKTLILGQLNSSREWSRLSILSLGLTKNQLSREKSQTESE